jgi:TRAP-type C4-dicarboxylate transport system permease small subunit
MKKILYISQKIEDSILVIAFAIMVAASFSQVVNRNIFKLPIGWFDEIAVYCMIYMVLLGTEIGLRDGSQIAVTSVVDRLHGKARKVVDIIAKLIVVAFSARIFISSINMLQMQIRTGQISAALKIPMSIPYAALTISFGIITVVQSITVLMMIYGFNKQDKINQGVK